MSSNVKPGQIYSYLNRDDQYLYSLIQSVSNEQISLLQFTDVDIEESYYDHGHLRYAPTLAIFILRTESLDTFYFGKLPVSKTEVELYRKAARSKLEKYHYDLDHFEQLWKELDAQPKFQIGKVYKTTGLGELAYIVTDIHEGQPLLACAQSTFRVNQYYSQQFLDTLVEASSLESKNVLDSLADKLEREVESKQEYLTFVKESIRQHE